jgi:hypothetical protein
MAVDSILKVPVNTTLESGYSCAAGSVSIWGF